MLLFTVLATPGFACSVPVFRYALDRWSPDAFQLIVPPAAARDRELAPLLKPAGNSAFANLEIINADSASGQSASRLVFPSPPNRALWSGTLTAEIFRHLTDSPARREIARRILAGDSVVWVLIECGRRDADEAVAGMLGKRLAYVQSVASLPEIDPNDPSNSMGPGPKLQIKFSVLRIRHDDPAETTLVNMLAGPDENPPPRDQPLVAPVFGRGRVLTIVNGGELKPETVDEMCMFLIGGCSCEVKDQNMGWDLLFNMDWDRELETVQLAAESAPGATAPAASTNSPAPETVTIRGADPQPAPARSDRTRTLAIAGAAVLLAVAGVLLLRGRRQKS